MARVNFYIEKRKDASGEIITRDVPIIFSFTFEHKRLYRPTGHRINAGNWNPSDQRVKASAKDATIINGYLDALESELKQVYWEARQKGIWPSVEYMKEHLTIYSKGKPVDFISTYQYFIDTELKLKSASTRKKHNSLLTHLETFSKEKKYVLEFSSITKKFYSLFVDYLLFDKKMINTTVSKYTGILHWFMAWAAKNGYHSNFAFRDFIPPTRRVKAVAANKVILTWDEVMAIYAKEMPSVSMEQVRDGFCLMCFTGMRYSDLRNLKKSDITADSIRIITEKTADALEIPLNNFSREILARWSHYPIAEAMPVISNQKFNVAIKRVGELAGITSPITITRYRGSEKLVTTAPKHELLSSHAGRRSFITIALKMGIPSEVVMKISGHRTHQLLELYYDIDDEFKKKEMEKFNKN